MTTRRISDDTLCGRRKITYSLDDGIGLKIRVLMYIEVFNLCE